MIAYSNSRKTKLQSVERYGVILQISVYLECHKKDMFLYRMGSTQP